MEQQQQQSASTPQIRSRITVVCAECKRLKLKCDRRSPCSSCTKRDTVARCIYSPAAAEKVDLHSLNNRLMQVEATLAQLTAGTFQSTYPPAQPQNVPSNPPALASPAANPTPSRNMSFPPNNHPHRPSPAAIMTHVHDSPCPLALSLDELRSAWLDSAEPGRLGRTPLGRPAHPVKLELSPVELERQSRLRTKLCLGTYPHSRHPNPQAFLPSVSIYYSTLPQSPYGSPSAYSPSVPSVTPEVLDSLPSTPTCLRIFARAVVVLNQRPVPLLGGWGGFERQALTLLNRRPGPTYPTGAGDSLPLSDGESESGRSNVPWEDTQPEESLPLFAMVSAILAIGAAVSPVDIFGAEHVNAGLLHALSQQALSVWEASPIRKSERDYISFLIACLAGIGYLLLVTPDGPGNIEGPEDQEGISAKPRAIFPLVGKMVNVAREIGLGKERAVWRDNEEEVGSRTNERQQAWDDFRRVVWWDVMFYDLFTSDSLGHPSLISPLSYSVKIPELVDGVYDQGMKKYIVARCRLIQLIQGVKQQLSHPDCCCGYTFAQASLLEDDIRRWSRESLYQSDDENSNERRHIWELSLTAQLVVLRAYVPFLIPGSSAATGKRQANGTSSASKLPGKPGSGDKPSIQGSTTAMAIQACLGAAQAILRLGNKLHVSLSKESGDRSTLVVPVLMDLYPLERLVLDAIVITQSSTAVSVVSETEVRRGLEIMVEREGALGKERKEIWDMMKQRVLATGKLQIPLFQGSQPGMQPGMKRKHDQLDSPVAANGVDIPSSKKQNIPSKHAKTMSGHPLLGVRYREGRMLPTGPVHTRDDYEQRDPRRSYTSLSNTPDIEPKVNQGTQMGTPQLQHPTQQAQQHLGSFVSSPTSFSPDHSIQVQAQHRTRPEHPLAPHNPSFDQSKSIYRFDEESTPGAFAEYVNGNNPVITGPASSSSSSPYNPNTPSFNPPQFGSPENRTPPQATTESPTVSFSGSDNQTFGEYTGGPPKFGSASRPPFENPRPTFLTDNPQPQTFERMAPPAFGRAEAENVQTPDATSGSADGQPHGPSPPQFGVPQPDVGHHPTGYFHPGVPVHPYDTGGMHQLGMRMDGSVPGTPIYEKSHMLYEAKPQQHPMLQHGGHPLQHALITSAFVTEQSEGLSIGGGPQPSHAHPQHQSWTSTQSSQPLVGVSTGQPFW